VKMKAIVAALLALLLFSVSSVAFDAVCVTASPKTIRVPQDYRTIQEAINWASAGDIILVAAGTYYENLVAREAVSIIGEDRTTTIIDGGGSETEPVVSIEANNVSLSGFTIQNGYHGIVVFSRGNSIINNTVKNNRYHGILLSLGGNVLRDNSMTNNAYNFGVQGWSLSDFINDIDASNTVDGKPVYYWANQHNKEIPAEAGYVAVINSTNIRVRNLKLAGNGQGVLFVFTRNSTIENVEAESNMVGISLVFSCGNIISDNTIASNDYGIQLFGETVIGPAPLYSSVVAVPLFGSGGNEIIGNKVANSSYCGIALWSSGGNVLKRNNMTGNHYSLDVKGRALSHFIQDIDASNAVDGKAIYYLVNQRDLIISSRTSPEIGYLGIINSTNVTVKDLTITKSGDGILFGYTRKSIMENVNASNCGHGISLVSSEGITINNNTVANNQIGIHLEASSGNIIVSNFASNNELLGIHLEMSDRNMIVSNVALNNEFSGIQLHESSGNDIIGNTISENSRGIELWHSSGNAIYCNNFINNTDHVESYWSTDAWDNGYPSGGNYWSDYTGVDFYGSPYQNSTGGDGIGDKPYAIDEDNQDRYPLMITKKPGFTLLVRPSSQTVNIGRSTTYQVTVVPIGGFTLDVSLGGSVDPKTSEISLTFSPTTVTLLGNSNLTVTTSTSTPLQTLELTITGTGGGETHVVKVKIVVECSLEVPHQAQGNTNWCGPASLAMVLRYYGYYKHSWDVAGDMNLARREGVTCEELYDYVREMYPELTVQLGRYPSKSDQILYDVRGNVSLGYPVILLIEHGVKKHAVVVAGCNETGFFVSDPGGILPTWSGRMALSEIHFFMTWDELYQFIYVVPTGTILIVKGKPSPLSGTMHINTYVELTQTHPSDIYARHGETSQYTYLDLDRGLVWKNLESHNAFDAQDNLTLTVQVSNHLPYEQHFTVAVSIVGEDQVIYFYNESHTSVAPYSIRYSVNTWRIDLKGCLTKSQNYKISIVLMDSARNQVDFFTTPAMYYSSELKLMPELPSATILSLLIIATLIAAAVVYLLYRFRKGSYRSLILQNKVKKGYFMCACQMMNTGEVAFLEESSVHALLKAVRVG